MHVESCMPVIPSADLEKSLRFWVEGLDLTMDRAMRRDGRLIGCMVHNEQLYFWLNERAGTPSRVIGRGTEPITRSRAERRQAIRTPGSGPNPSVFKPRDPA